MDRKNIFGTILTLLGTCGLISASIWFVDASEGADNTKALVVLGILSFVFFMIGINMVNTTKGSA